MTNYGKLFYYELTNCMIYEEGFKQSKCQMSVYYKYVPDGSKLFVFRYVDDCIYWYTYEELVKWFVDTLGKICHMNLLGCEHWFMSISISQLKDHSSLVYQAKYGTSVVVKYLYTATIK